MREKRRENSYLSILSFRFIAFSSCWVFADSAQRPDGLRSLVTVAPAAALGGSVGRWLAMCLPGRGLGPGVARLLVVGLVDLRHLVVAMAPAAPRGGGAGLDRHGL